jgi:putative SOS response-associated peptidase YedK
MADDRLMITCRACDGQLTLASIHSCSMTVLDTARLDRWLRVHIHSELAEAGPQEVICEFPVDRFHLSTEGDATLAPQLHGE